MIQLHHEHCMFPRNRPDSGPEFAARKWLGRIGVKTLDIEPGKSMGERLL